MIVVIVQPVFGFFAGLLHDDGGLAKLLLEIGRFVEGVLVDLDGFIQETDGTEHAAAFK